MHAVRCPHCQRLLKVGRAAQDAKFRCRECGKVFVASTRQVAEAQAAAAAGPSPPSPQPAAVPAPGRAQRPAGAAGYRARGYQAPAQWPALLAIFAAIAIIGLVIVAYYLRTYGHHVYKAPDGRIVFSGRLSDEEWGKKKAELDAKYGPKLPPGGAAGAGTGGSRGGPPGGSGRVSAATDPNLVERGQRYTTGEIAELQTAGDQNIRVTGVTTISGGVDENTILIGRVVNNHAEAVESLQVTIRYVDAEGRARQLPTITCMYLPGSGGEARFSVDVAVPQDQIKSFPPVQVSAVKRPGGRFACLPIGDARRKLKGVAEDLFVLVGEARNTTARGIEGAWVWCDFYNDEWVWRGAAKGKLVDGPTTIGPGRSADFQVEFEPPLLPDEIQYWLPRLVGRSTW